MKASTYVNPSLSLYHHLAKLPWPKSYAGKLLLIALIGVQIPMLAILFFVVFGSRDWGLALPLVLVGLFATLTGTLLTLIFQGKALAPVLETAQALADYTQYRKVPKLPTNFTDEAGVLMSNAQLCITNSEQLLKLKNNFLAILSHDIRSPLSDILLLSEIIEEELNAGVTDVERLRKLLQQIRASAYFQLDMVNGILNVARSEVGKLEANRTKITVCKILERVATNVELHTKRNEIQFSITTEGNQESIVHLDVPKTVQVLNNLLQNALKFTPAGGTVELNAAVQPDQVIFTVRDTGVGIEPEAVHRLFEPFTALRSYGTTEEISSGLGLWICRTFTEVQGGHIEVKSQPNEGSTFQVYLPLISPEAQAA